MFWRSDFLLFDGDKLGISRRSDIIESRGKNDEKWWRHPWVYQCNRHNITYSWSFLRMTRTYRHCLYLMKDKFHTILNIFLCVSFASLSWDMSLQSCDIFISLNWQWFFYFSLGFGVGSPVVAFILICKVNTKTQPY